MRVQILDLKRRRRQVEARRVVGVWAVHLTLNRDPEDSEVYSVTHMPTGRTVMQGAEYAACSDLVDTLEDCGFLEWGACYVFGHLPPVVELRPLARIVALHRADVAPELL